MPAAGGPNFFEFGDDVRNGIHIDHDGDGYPDGTCRFEFTTEITIPSSFLYHTGPISSLNSRNEAVVPMSRVDLWNRLSAFEGQAGRPVRRAFRAGRVAARAVGGSGVQLGTRRRPRSLRAQRHRRDSRADRVGSRTHSRAGERHIRDGVPQCRRPGIGGGSLYRLVGRPDAGRRGFRHRRRGRRVRPGDQRIAGAG
ncbi:DUF4331 family protein [Micromonospora sp. CB01531]|uniref:DUF4331 family protein n=1 Tax=Micromonospora sp. CB01531 TaxID=1718947 RepID=UPI000A6D2712|nr:DUF4331 family protein [Micromonospora sp. CB01531]